MSRYEVETEIVVEIEVHDPDVFDRCFTEDWQSHYWKVEDRSEVLKHLAFNAVCNGVEDISRLDGWADLPSTAATINVDRSTWYSSASGSDLDAGR